MKTTDLSAPTNMSDDEDELELLRNAALQTLKKSVENPVRNKFHSGPPHPKRGRGFNRNGQFNGRSNPNLISIPTIESQPKKLLSNPDRRYNMHGNGYSSNSADDAEAKKESKFSRYDDESTEDSETEQSEPEQESPNGTVGRSGSIEMLVQELEHEISGEQPASMKKAKSKKAKHNNLMTESADTTQHNDSGDAIAREEDDSEAEARVDENEGAADADPNDYLQLDSVDDNIDDLNAKEAAGDEGEQVSSTNSNFLRASEAMESQPLLADPPIAKIETKGGDVSRRTGLGKMFPRGGSRAKSFIRRMMDATRHPFNVGNLANVPAMPYVPYSPFGYAADIPPYQPTSIYPPTVPSTSAPITTFASYTPQLVQSARPLSPLHLDAEALSNIAMAPLSPRSAAFVLQNREIIEKRKRSPRRSFSRSRSPSPRGLRSKSPRRQRSASPQRRLPRSVSPKRSSPHAKRLSPRSPLRRTLAPRSPLTRAHSSRSPREASPKRSASARRNAERNDDLPPKRKRTTSPDTAVAPKRDEKAVQPKAEAPAPDPLLEARRKKFEQGVVPKEGVIRLKPKEADVDEKDEDQTEETTDDVDTQPTDDDVDELPTDSQSTSDTIPIGPLVRRSMEDFDIEQDLESEDDKDTIESRIDVIFSDEDSDENDENEGRFKSPTSTSSRPAAPILQFAKLVNGPARDVQVRSLEATCRERESRTRERRDGSRRGDSRASEYARRERTPPRKRRCAPEDNNREDERKDERKEGRHADDGSKEKKSRTDEKKSSRAAANKETDEKTRPTRKHAAENDASSPERKPKSRPPMAGARKVAIAKDNVKEKETTGKSKRDEKATDGDDDVVFTVIDDDEEQNDVVKKNEAGDLRAQLSRKRAERQHQKPVVTAEDVQSRLLHNALGAVFQKSTKPKRKADEAAPKDRKIPIHQRLGIGKDIALDKPSKKKRHKRNIEQV